VTCSTATPRRDSELWRPGTLDLKAGRWSDLKGATTISLWASTPELKSLLCSRIEAGIPGAVTCILGEACGRINISFQSAEWGWACTHCDDQSKAGEGMPKYNAFAYVTVLDGCDQVAAFELLESGDSQDDLARHFAVAFVGAVQQANRT
jgi:hypothetical protein